MPLPIYNKDSHEPEMASEHEMNHEDVHVMIPKDICPDMEFKPGDEIILKVVGVKGDMLEVEYAEGEEDHEMPSEHDAMNMPLDKLEKKLPHANREEM